VTFAYLETDSGTERIRRRLTALWDYPKYGAPFKKAAAISLQKSGSRIRPSSTRSVADGGAGSVARSQHVVGGRTVALSILAVCEDGGGGPMVYAHVRQRVGLAGIPVRDVATRRPYDHLKWIKFSSAHGRTMAQDSSTAAYPSRRRRRPAARGESQPEGLLSPVGTDQSADRWSTSGPTTDWDRREVSATAIRRHAVWLGTDRRNRILLPGSGDPNTRGSMPPSSGCSTTSMRRTASSATRARALFPDRQQRSAGRVSPSIRAIRNRRMG